MPSSNVLNADVLVVGAGLAGMSAGYALRQAGLDVLAVELRDARKKDKLCAGLFRADTITTLNQLYGIDALQTLVPMQINTWTTICQQHEYSIESRIFGLERRRLDDFALDKFVEAGGRLADRLRLDRLDIKGKRAFFLDLRSGEKVEVRYRALVGADGAGSSVRRLTLGQRQQTCLGLEGAVARTRDDLVMRIYPLVNGYCWYMPRGADATVGVCLLHAKANPASCRAELAEFCEDLGIEMPELRGAPIPMLGDIVLQPADSCYLVGDAAGLINSEAGGIQQAIVSGVAAARAIAGGKPYDEAMARLVQQLDEEASRLTERYLARCVFTLRG